jgi:hypothetical protein
MISYRITFTQRNTMATFSHHRVRKGGRAYFLKAVSENKKSRQHVGYAIIYPEMIEVITVSGSLVGIAKDRKEAVQMIDSYHRTSNADTYWMWAEKELAI